MEQSRFKLVIRNQHLAVLGILATTCGGLMIHLKSQSKSLARKPVPVVGVTSTIRKGKGALKVDKVFRQRLLKILRVVFSFNGKETMYLIILLFQLVCRTWVTHTLSKLAGRNAQGLVNREWKVVLEGIAKFFLVGFPASLLNSSRKYVHDMLALQIRMKVSKLVINEYVCGVNFYKATNLGEIKLDNPDQRVTADINSFSDELTDLVPSTLKPILDIFVFTYQLVNLLGWQGPSVMFGYFFITGLVKRKLMPSFGRFVATESELEGYYRTAHNRLITNAEEIAFFDGSQRERTIISSALKAIGSHAASFRYLRLLVGVLDQLMVKYWASIAGYIAFSMPFILNLPHVANHSAGDVTRDYIYTIFYIQSLANAIGEIVLLGNRLGNIAGYTHRVGELMDTIQKLNKDGVPPFAIKEDVTEEGPQAKPSEAVHSFLESWRARCQKQQEQRIAMRHDPDREFHQAIGGGEVIFTEKIQFDNCDIVSPDGQLLAEKLSFEVRPGVNVMVTGPNGCGKSSLFRVIGELWPLQNGKLSKPHREDVIFVPQRPYLVIGTLRDQIIYPHSQKQMQELGVTDEDLARLLATVDPAQKIVSSWKWDDVRDWFVALSGGQKQRVAMARLFYHCPKFAILDECTSAVSADIEGAIYSMAKDLGITIFTVSHRAALKKHHDYVLELDGRGQWKFERIDHTDLNALHSAFATA